MASVLASAQITMTTTKPRIASPGSSSTNFGKNGAHSVAGLQEWSPLYVAHSVRDLGQWLRTEVHSPLQPS